MPRFRILPERPYREFPGAFGKFARFSRWLTRGDVRPLREDEYISFEALAWMLAGLRPNYRWQRWTNRMFGARGTLRLTNQRLVWMPYSYRLWPRVSRFALPVVEIDLSEIATVERVRGEWLRRFWLFYIPALRIALQDGSKYMLAAPFGGTLAKAIAEAAGVENA